MDEHERTFLAKYLPEDLNKDNFRKMLDIYLPSSDEHPNLRIRQKGENYEITRKSPVDESDVSHQIENTIELSKKEFDELNALKGKRVHKRRFEYKHGDYMYEIDVFQDALEGLVLVDVEFEDPKEKKKFEMPDFCLVDITQEEFIAGGMLAGKSYADIESKLAIFEYKKLSL